MQGPFLVSTEPSKTWYEKFATTYREPNNDFLTLMNVAKLLFGLFFAKKDVDAKKTIEESSISTKVINEKMGNLVKDLPHVCAKMEESKIELKKLNDSSTGTRIAAKIYISPGGLGF